MQPNILQVLLFEVTIKKQKQKQKQKQKKKAKAKYELR